MRSRSELAWDGATPRAPMLISGFLMCRHANSMLRETFFFFSLPANVVVVAAVEGAPVALSAPSLLSAVAAVVAAADDDKKNTEREEYFGMNVGWKADAVKAKTEHNNANLLRTTMF
jgi:hypothetical protein